MQLSNIPAKIAAIFAASAPTGYKNTIPLTQAGISQPGQASFDVGFPSVTMQPASAGGINPYGQDFNGLAYALTGPLQWLCAGGTFPFDSAFVTAVGGYPKGAILQNANGDGYWLNIADNNTANPDTGGANWVPLNGYGLAAVAGLTNSNVTLTPAQYSKKVITLAGTLTGNVQIIFPTIQQQWLVVNNTTGAFTVTCKTASGTGGTVPQNGLQTLWGDGANLNFGPGDSRYASVASSPIVGSTRNARMSITAASASGTFSADEIVVESALGGTPFKLSSFSKNINLATTGAGGMDTGTAPTNGYVAVYAIYNPVTQASALLGVNATSAAQPNIYGGVNMPAGYTASALVSVWPTNSSGQFIVGYQNDRFIYFAPTAAITSGAQTSYTSVLISGVVPPNARSVDGYMIVYGSSFSYGYVASSSSGIGEKQVSGYTGTTAPPAAPFSNLPIITPQTIYYKQNSASPGITVNINGYSF